jgi:hypothetical protein
VRANWELGALWGGFGWLLGLFGLICTRYVAALMLVLLLLRFAAPRLRLVARRTSVLLIVSLASSLPSCTLSMLALRAYTRELNLERSVALRCARDTRECARVSGWLWSQLQSN